MSLSRLSLERLRGISIVNLRMRSPLGLLCSKGLSGLLLYFGIPLPLNTFLVCGPITSSAVNLIVSPSSVSNYIGTDVSASWRLILCE